MKGNYKHGICSDDYVRIYEGTIHITGTVSDGIHANDAVVIDGGVLNIVAGGSVTGGSDFYGLYIGGQYSGGTSTHSFTIGSMVTTVGSFSGGIEGGGNNPGRPGGR